MKNENEFNRDIRDIKKQKSSSIIKKFVNYFTTIKAALKGLYKNNRVVKYLRRKEQEIIFDLTPEGEKEKITNFLAQAHTAEGKRISQNKERVKNIVSNLVKNKTNQQSLKLGEITEKANKEGQNSFYNEASKEANQQKKDKIKEQIKNIKGLNLEETYEKVNRNDFFFGNKLNDQQKEDYIVLEHYGKARGIFQVNRYLSHPDIKSESNKARLFNIIYPEETLKNKKGTVLISKGGKYTYLLAPLGELSTDIGTPDSVRLLNSNKYGEQFIWQEIEPDGFNRWEREEDIEKGYTFMMTQQFQGRRAGRTRRDLSEYKLGVAKGDQSQRANCEAIFYGFEDWYSKDDKLLGTDWGTVLAMGTIFTGWKNKRELNGQIRRYGYGFVCRARMELVNRMLSMDIIRSEDNINNALVLHFARLRQHNRQVRIFKKRNNIKTKADEINRVGLQSMEEYATEMLGEKGLALLSPDFRAMFLRTDSPIQDVEMTYDIPDDPYTWETEMLEDELEGGKITSLMKDGQNKLLEGTLIQEEYKEKILDSLDDIVEYKAATGLDMIEKEELRDVFGEGVDDLKAQFDSDLYEEFQSRQEYFQIGSDEFYGRVDYTFLKSAMDLEAESKTRIFGSKGGFLRALENILLNFLEIFWWVTMTSFISLFWIIHIYYLFLSIWYSLEGLFCALVLVLEYKNELLNIEFYLETFHTFKPHTVDELVTACQSGKQIFTLNNNQAPSMFPPELKGKVGVYHSFLSRIRRCHPRVNYAMGVTKDYPYLVSIFFVIPFFCLVHIFALEQSELELEYWDEFDDDDDEDEFEELDEDDIEEIENFDIGVYPKPVIISGIPDYLNFFYKTEDKRENAEQSLLKAKTNLKEGILRKLKKKLAILITFAIRVKNHKIIKWLTYHSILLYDKYIGPKIKGWLLKHYQRKAKQFRAEQTKKYFRQKQILAKITELRELKKLTEANKLPDEKFKKQLQEFFDDLNKEEKFRIGKLFRNVGESTLLGQKEIKKKEFDEKKEYFKFMYNELDKALETVMIEEGVRASAIQHAAIKFKIQKDRLGVDQSFTEFPFEKKCVYAKQAWLDFVLKQCTTGEEVANRQEEIITKFRLEIKRKKADKKEDDRIKEAFWYWGEDVDRSNDDES